MSTYAWQEYYKQFPNDGTTPLSQVSEKLFSLADGQAIRRILFKQEMRAYTDTSPANLPPGTQYQYIATVCAVAAWLNPAINTALSSPPVLTDRNSESWLFHDFLEQHVEYAQAVDGVTCGNLWTTPPGGLDIKSQRLAVAGNSNDVWVGWQFNDPAGNLNTNVAGYKSLLGGWLQIRFLIETAS